MQTQASLIREDIGIPPVGNLRTWTENFPALESGVAITSFRFIG